MPNTPFNPSWSKYEKDMASNDLDTAIAATDEFEKEKAREVAASIKARQWDKDRKSELMRFKPKWIKERRKKEQDPALKTLEDLKKAGSFNSNVTPLPGYVLVEVDTIEQTKSGIFLQAEQEPNTGRIIAISGTIEVPQGIAKCPVKPGDRVLFKKYAGTGGAGLEIIIKGKDYRLMRWNLDPQQTDLLAIL